MTVAIIFGTMLMLSVLILFALYLVVRSADKPNKKPVVPHILGHWQ